MNAYERSILVINLELWKYCKSSEIVRNLALSGKVYVPVHIRLVYAETRRLSVS